MIPPFDANGNLPPGIHVANWAEIQARFGTNPRRQHLLAGLADALFQFRLAGCRRVYIDGSFVTAEPAPGDYDCCYDPRGIDPTFLDRLFLNPWATRAAQKAKYGGEFFPNSSGAAYSFLQFFQVDKGTGEAKGIVAIDLGGAP